MMFGQWKREWRQGPLLLLTRAVEAESDVDGPGRRDEVDEVSDASAAAGVAKAVASIALAGRFRKGNYYYVRTSCFRDSSSSCWLLY